MISRYVDLAVQVACIVLALPGVAAAGMHDTWTVDRYDGACHLTAIGAGKSRLTFSSEPGGRVPGQGVLENPDWNEAPPVQWRMWKDDEIGDLLVKATGMSDWDPVAVMRAEDGILFTNVGRIVGQSILFLAFIVAERENGDVFIALPHGEVLGQFTADRFVEAVERQRDCLDG